MRIKALLRCMIMVGGILLSSLPIWADNKTLQTTLPSVGNARIVVCGQNTKNYFVVDLTADRADAKTKSALEAKTRKMVEAFLAMDADIYALNELEVNDSVLGYLTAAMNKKVGKKQYAFIKDGLNGDNTQIKSGYLYRVDKVKPYGANSAGSNQYYYRNTMRIQAFEELSTGERFVLSVNHFKAKDSSDDKGNSKREKNAQDLLSALERVTTDPDILIVGDLNCEIYENPLEYIVNAGYEEALLSANSNAYSYIYKGNKQLIDHVFGNTTMTEQITGAGVYHINTSGSSAVKYSDHDPYLVGLSLNGNGSTPDPDPNPDGDCTEVSFKQDFKEGLGEFVQYRSNGELQWSYNEKYGAIANGYNTNGGEMDVWLISPAFDLSGAESAEVTFRHNLYKDNSNGNYAKWQTLWVGTDYEFGSDPQYHGTWKQLNIPQFSVGKYVNCTVEVPKEMLSKGFHFAFRYKAYTKEQANFWEIDHAALHSTCPINTNIEEVEGGDRIDLEDVNTRVYTIMGQDMTSIKDDLPSGMYIVVNGNCSEKLIVQ